MDRALSLPSRVAQTPVARSAPLRRGGLWLSLTCGLAALGWAGAAGADVAPPPPPPECVGKPDGTLCVRANGTAGQCKTGRSERQPGKTWVFCAADGHECDHLEIGAVCHGYLGKPSHCKEFTSAEKQTWRTCQADGIDAPAADGPAAATGSSAAPPPAAKKRLLSCTAAPGAPAAGSASAVALWSAALWLTARRRARARS